MASVRKRYSRSVISITLGEPAKKRHPLIVFTEEDFEGVQAHEDDPVVVSVVTARYNVKRVLIDQGSSADVMFWSTFVGLGIPESNLQSFKGTLLARGYIEQRTTFGSGDNAKTVMVRYIVVNSPSSYNIIIGRGSLNALNAVVSTSHLAMK